MLIIIALELLVKVIYNSAMKQNLSFLNRREFLRMVSAIGISSALAALLEACSSYLPVASTPTSSASLSVTKVPTQTVATPSSVQIPSSTPAPTVTPVQTVAPDKAIVSLVRTSDRASGVRQAIDLLNISPITGKSVFLKPNFNSADPTPGSTHPDTLRALIVRLQELGAGKITIGDRSGMGDTRRVMNQLGVFDMAQELGCEVLVLYELSAEAWVNHQPTGSHWLKGFPFARPCLDSDVIVQTCCLKTHRYGGHFTLSLKNSVGLVAKRVPGEDYDYMNELHGSPYQRSMIAEINTAYTPNLIVMDGVDAFVTGGPDTGERVSPKVLLASTDRVAIDAVGVAILRHFGTTTEVSSGPIFAQEQIARAVELGLGVEKPQKIQFATGNAESADFAEQINNILLQN